LSSWEARDREEIEPETTAAEEESTLELLGSWTHSFVDHLEVE